MAWSSERGAGRTSAGRTSAEPRFYFSLRSPYSWLALHDLATRYPDVAGTVRWRPFWEPDEASAAALRERGGDFPYAPMSRAKHLYILQDVKRLAAARGLTPAWPVDRAPVWEVPHLAYLLAERHGVGRAFVTAVTDARWVRGLDICDRAVIGTVAAEVGLDRAEAAGAADDPDLRAEGVRRLLDVCADGVFGVPYFRQGRARFWGIDRLPAFVGHVRSGTGHPEPQTHNGEPQTHHGKPRTHRVESPPGDGDPGNGAGAPHTVEGGHAGGCG